MSKDFYAPFYYQGPKKQINDNGTQSRVWNSLIAKMELF